jgi:hypothetical protein
MNQMQRVAGLIVSLPTTRIAIITRRVDGTCIANMTTVTVTAKKADTLADICARIADVSTQTLHAVCWPVLAVIQEPAGASRRDSASTGLWWRLVTNLLADSPVAVSMSLARRQSAATGLAGAITPLWPDARLSAPQEAPALALAHMGALHLGWDVPAIPDGALDALGTIVWPEGLPGPQSASA